MSVEERFLNIISGRSRGPVASATRAALGAVSPLFGIAVRLRNRRFDRHEGHRLPRPVVSIGNLTTGGTGKTPLVQWIAARLIASGQAPAVLLRGYRQQDGMSDEAELYRNAGLVVGMNPDRVAGAAAVLDERPSVDVFLLDDGFQHRRVARDLNLVLLDATNPFGFDHLLPRGLLREPPASLKRADAVIITRSDQAGPLDGLVAQIRRHAPGAPIYRCRHTLTGLLDRNGRLTNATAIGSVTALAGIGNPAAFFNQLETDLGLTLADRLPMPDHHVYTPADLPPGNGPIVTTEKDWTKLRHLPGIDQRPIYRAALTIEFNPGDDAAIMELIEIAIANERSMAGGERKKA